MARQDPSFDSSEQANQRRVRHRFRKGVYVVPSLLTTANIFCGFYSVMESLAGVRFLEDDVVRATDHFNRAAINIGFATLFDFMDGRIARMTGATSEFGIELDSIADVVSFGVAPALLAYAWGFGQFPELHKFAWAACFLFVICGALRLARFNVQARQPKPNAPPKNPKVDRKAFVGMPIPMGAAMIAALAHFSPRPIKYTPGWRTEIFGVTLVVDEWLFSKALLALVVLLSFLMISTIRYSSFKNVGARKDYHPRMLIVAIALIVLAIWAYSQWTLLIITTVYVAHPLAVKLWSLMRPRSGDTTEHAGMELERK